MALSLSAFRVNITLLTDGGQSVTLYTVSVDVGTHKRFIYTDVTGWDIVCTNHHRLRSEE